ncbi:hypothetical protein [Tenacibaculum sp. 190130A14a]|uniref:SRPBCC family protein n=1 Tax=Tenacibaculum polynesiense TaxID=3137857 RepID=A0ABM9P8C0_9FLAO
MKNLILAVAMLVGLTSCGQHGHGSFASETNANSLAQPTNFPTVGFKKEYQETIEFPVAKVFPLFEPQGRSLLYSKWNPILLKEGEDGSLKGRIEFSKYDDLDVFLKVTKYNPKKGHIQYFITWDDFEVQRIDIFCTPGEKENTTKIRWIEYNAGLYEKGEKLVSMFVKKGYLVKVVQRYINNIKKQLENGK